MPATSPANPELPSWQQALSQAVRNIDELARLLELPVASLRAFEPHESEFPLLVPRGFVRRMRKGDPSDPLLRQVLPLTQERQPVPGYSNDPLGETTLARGGLLKKYAGRALLIATATCPVHCRYCFRRSFPYRDHLASHADWEQALAELDQNPDVQEVILSGGDPLSLNERRLATLFDALAHRPWISRVRIHTRYPVVLPERIDASLLRLLEQAAFRIVVVIHANHGNEIDQQVTTALTELARCGAVLLNQSVLLRGVNDDAAILVELSERLFAAGVLPYYLHLLDPVAGAAHYEVEEARARILHAELTGKLPGYLVPRLVREIPGMLSKTLIA
jgi:EF-P beta-lysylation protein EpmB